MKQEAIHPEYWSVYKAINLRRYSKTREFADAKTGKVLSYSFAHDGKKFDFWIALCSLVLWTSPAYVIVMLSAIYGQSAPGVFVLGALAVIGYHFLGMYYVIRGPLIHYSEVKKKGFFGL